MRSSTSTTGSVERLASRSRGVLAIAVTVAMCTALLAIGAAPASATEQTPSTVTIDCPGSVTYDGSAHEPCTATVTGDGGFSESVPVMYDSNTDAGTANVNATYSGDSEHAPSSATTTFTIEKADSVVTVNCSGSVTYDGSAQEPCSAEVTGAGGLSQSLDVLYESNTDAGTANAWAWFDEDANHNSSSGSASFTIDQAPSSVSVDCSGSATFDGSAHEPCTAEVTGAGGLSQSVGVVYNSNWGAGTATADATFDGDLNHTGSSGSASFTIDPGDSLVSIWCPSNVAFDGSAQEPCTAEVSGAGGLFQTVPVSYSSNTDAGTATAYASFDGDDNHTGSSGSASFTIDQASSTVTVVCSPSVTYTGSALEPCTATVSGAGGLSQSVPVSYSSNTEAGSASAFAEFLGDGNHTGSSGSASFTIDQASSTVMIDCPGSVTFDGSPQEPCTATVSGAGGLSQSIPIGYSSNTDAGSASAFAEFLGDGNHTGSSGSASFTIDQAESSVSVNCPASVPFIGSAQEPCSAEVTGAGGLSQPLQVTYDSNGGAGTATAHATFDGDANHTPSSGSSSFSIDPGGSMVMISCPPTVVFDGSAQEPCSATVFGDGGLSESVPVSYTANTDAGAANAYATFDGDANHTGSSSSSGFQILQADSTVSVTCSGSVTFDGNPHEPCTAEVTGAGGLWQSLTVTYDSNTDAGAANAYATFDGDANHAGSSGSSSFSIDQASSSVTIDCPGSVTFDGSAQEPCTATVTGAGGLSASVPVMYSSNTDAGTATAGAIFDGDANHAGSIASLVEFTIVQADSTVSVSCSGPVTFDGMPQEPCTAEVTGAGGLWQALAVTYDSNTDAGTASAYATFDGDANHTGSSGSASFTIDQASSSVMIDCPGSVTFNGSPYEPCSAEVTGAGGLSQSLTVSYDSNFGAGTASASAVFDGDQNHTGSSGSSSFTIDPGGSSVYLDCPGSAVFDGSAQEPCYAQVFGDGGLSQSIQVTYSSNTDAGTASAYAEFAGDGNHTGSSSSSGFQILQADSTVSVNCSGPVVFDGTPQEPCTAEVTGAGGLSQPLTVIYDSNIDAGVANASATFDGDTNHTGSSGSSSFGIDLAESSTTISCPESVVFDGSAQEPCTAEITGVAGLSRTVQVYYLSNIEVGTATAHVLAHLDRNHLDSSDVVTFAIRPAAPAAPTSLVATPGNNSVSVAFSAGAANGAAITNYEYQLDGSGSWVSFSPAVTSSPVVIPVTNGVSYTVKLRAVNSVGSGASSVASSSFTPRTTPSAPTALVGTEDNGSAVVAFTPGSNGGSAITKYQYRVGNGSWLDAIGTSPITVPGLVNYTTVSIRIRAVNVAGAGETSEAVTVRPRAAGPRITKVSTPGRGSIHVEYSAVSIPRAIIAGYTVTAYERGTNSVVSSCRSTPASRRCDITNLDAGRQYDIRVIAYFKVPGDPVTRSTLQSATSTVTTGS